MLNCQYIRDIESWVLISGERSDLVALAKQFDMAARWGTLSDYLRSALGAITELVLEEPPKGMTTDGDALSWSFSRSDARAFAEMVRSLAEGCQPGHQYLDTSNGAGLEVVVSRGEYPADFLRA